MNAVGTISGDPLADEGDAFGPDPDVGKLFDVPRVGVIVDTTDPTVIKLAFSGSYELDRSNAEQVGHYNELVAGETAEIVVVVHVAGAKQIHRRDAEGDVDAVVQTKSLVVDEVFFSRPEE